MAPKDTKKSAKISIPNKDGFARASYLLQAAHVMTPKDEIISRMYLRSMDLVTKKNVLKVDPLVKRQFCKKCDRLEVSGTTCSISVVDEGKKSEMFKVRCKCGAIKRYPVGRDPNYVLFTEKNAK